VIATGIFLYGRAALQLNSKQRVPGVSLREIREQDSRTFFAFRWKRMHVLQVGWP